MIVSRVPPWMEPVVGAIEDMSNSYLKVLAPGVAGSESPLVSELTSTVYVAAIPPGRPTLI